MNKKIIIIGIIALIIISSLASIIVFAQTSAQSTSVAAECPALKGSVRGDPPGLILINTPNKYKVTAYMKNKGLIWESDEETSYKLKITDGPAELKNRYIELPNQATIYRDQIANFELPEQPSPSTPQTITLKWRMVEIKNDEDGSIESFFGPECTYSFNVENLDSQCKALSNSAEVGIFAVDFFPITSNEPNHQILPGEKYVARISLKNTGTTTWQQLLLPTYVLEGSIGGNKVYVRLSDLASGIPTSSVQVRPGSEIALEYKGVAPTTSGTLETQWQMKVGNKKFGAICSGNMVVAVKNENSACDNLDIVLGGNSREFNVKSLFKNTGNTIWKKDYKAVVAAGINQLSLGFDEFENPDLTPGGFAKVYRTLPLQTFTTITKTVRLADMNPQPAFGTYKIAFKMKQGNEEFGSVCKKQIDIKPRFAIV